MFGGWIVWEGRLLCAWIIHPQGGTSGKMESGKRAPTLNGRGSLRPWPFLFLRTFASYTREEAGKLMPQNSS
jgi:hypothetical protein